MKRKIYVIFCVAILVMAWLTLAACDDGSPVKVDSQQTTEVITDPAVSENETDAGITDPVGSEPSSDELVITVDENGLATWDPVPQAQAYEYCFIYEDADGVPTGSYSSITTDTCLQIPAGHRLDLRVLFLDGSISFWTCTDYFGELPGGEGVPPPVQFYDKAAPTVRLSEDGIATWDALKDVISYDIRIQSQDENGVWLTHYAEEIAEPVSIPLQEGYRLLVRANYSDMDISEGACEVYGDPSKRTELKYGQIFWEYDVRWEDLKSYELIGNIDRDSVRVAEDGTVTFNATGPKGEIMRFFGSGVRVDEDSVSLMPGGFLTSLDAIGRIMYYELMTDKGRTDTGDDRQYVSTEGGYTLSDKTSVDSYLDLTYVMGWSKYTVGDLMPFVDDGGKGSPSGNLTMQSMLSYQPNFITLKGNPQSTENVSLFELYVYYDEVYTTEVECVKLNTDFYGFYLEGERYDVEREGFANGAVPQFYLVARLKQSNRLSKQYTYEEWARLKYSDSLYTISPTVYEIGAMRDASGNVVDKETAKLMPGMTLDLIFGDQTLALPLPVAPLFRGGTVMHSLVPYAYPEAVGTLNTLVIPIGWQDEPENADEDEYARFLSELGRVMDEDGNVVDHSFDHAVEKRFSLSEYYDIASFGKLKIQSFMTDWYRAPYDFAEMKTRAPDLAFMQELAEWLYATYPDMDWTKFDQDRNGYFDAVVLLNAGAMTEPGFDVISFSGGIMTRLAYTGEYAGTPERPFFNCYTNLNAHLLSENTLIHEYAHGLGLIDYYDVTYSGIDAVGRFDMQSMSHGDWNAYSKYAVGWLEPKTVTGLAVGESVEIEIGSSALTGDAIVIPGASSEYGDSPFGEYILIDLFSDAGVNRYDAEVYSLNGVSGVRIYHVNALMEQHDEVVEGHDAVYSIGTVHVANNYTGDGKYNLELIQAGGKNTFTNLESLRTSLCEEDLFAKGDVFTMDDYSEFFGNGLMDDGTEFGYRIEIVELVEGDNPSATIRVTRE